MNKRLRRRKLPIRILFPGSFLHRMYPYWQRQSRSVAPFLNRFGLIESNPDSARERICESDKPRILVLVGCSGFARGIAGKPHRPGRSGGTTLDDAPQDFRNCPRQRRRYHCLFMRVSLVYDVSFAIVNSLDQIRFLKLAMRRKNREGGG